MKMKIGKIGGRTWMGVALMLLSLGVFITALEWPHSAALFPITIAVFVFVLAAIEVALGLFLETEKETSTMDFKMASAEDADIDEATVHQRIVVISLWIFGLFALILLIGFPAAVPLFFVLFLKLYAQETWKMTVALAVVAWAFFYGVFIRILHVPFDDGWVISGLRALGIMS